MPHVCILGVGLIGGSLGRALRKVKKNGKRSYVVSGWGRKITTLKKAKSLGALDSFSMNLKEVVSNSDVVVLSTPVQTMLPLLKNIVPFLKDGAIVTDVGSVKEEIVNRSESYLRNRKDIVFVGAHPIAGSEKNRS